MCCLLDSGVVNLRDLGTGILVLNIGQVVALDERVTCLKSWDVVYDFMTSPWPSPISTRFYVHAGNFRRLFLASEPSYDSFLPWLPLSRL